MIELDSYHVHVFVESKDLGFAVKVVDEDGLQAARDYSEVFILGYLGFT